MLTRLGFLKDERVLDETFLLALTRGETGGVLKRIDENRELLETLRSKCPTVLYENWWIEGWIASNDRFFTTLQAILGIKNTHRAKDSQYPRQWPMPADAQPVDELAVLREAVELLGFDCRALAASLLAAEERPAAVEQLKRLAANNSANQHGTRAW